MHGLCAYCANKRWSRKQGVLPRFGRMVVQIIKGKPVTENKLRNSFYKSQNAWLRTPATEKTGKQGFPAIVMLLVFQNYKADSLSFMLSDVQIYLKLSTHSTHGPLTRNDAWNITDFKVDTKVVETEKAMMEVSFKMLPRTQFLHVNVPILLILIMKKKKKDFFNKLFSLWIVMKCHLPKHISNK